MRRKVVCEAPPEIGLAPHMVLVVLRPLYGLPEAALHWYNTYSDFHTTTLDMRPTAADPCLFYTFSTTEPSSPTTSANPGRLVHGNAKDNEETTSVSPPDGLVALQVDDSAILGTARFLQKEEEALGTFPSKPAIFLQDNGSQVTFKGVELRKRGSEYVMSTNTRCANFDEIVSTTSFLKVARCWPMQLFGLNPVSLDQSNCWRRRLRCRLRKT